MGGIAACPICGGPAYCDCSEEAIKASNPAAYVQCYDCGASSGLFLFSEDALHAWNHRPQPKNPKTAWLHSQCGDCGYLIPTRDGVGRICRRSNNTFNEAGVLDNDPACPDFRRRA